MDSSDSDDDVPLGQLIAAARKPDKVASSSSTSAKKKRPISYKEASDDSDEDFQVDDNPPAPKTKKAKVGTKTTNGSSQKKPTAATKVKKEPAKKKSAAAAKPKKESKPKQLKQLDKVERISHGMQAYQWWNGNDPPKGCQWVKMEHAGVSFPEGYVPHGVKMLYDGTEVELGPAEEEA